MITNGDSQKFTSLDEFIYVHDVNSMRDMCGQNLVAKFMKPLTLCFIVQ